MSQDWTIGLSDSEVEQARELHFNSLVIDCLGGSVIRRPPPAVDGQDIFQQRLAAGVNISNETLASDREDFRDAVTMIYAYYTLVEVASERALLVESVDDIKAAKEQDKVGLILGFQGATPFEDDVGLIYILQKLGIRITGLAYNRRNALGDGCYEPVELGLTATGRRVVAALNDAGITVDLSHVGEKTSLEAADASAKPVIFSHSNVRALTPHTRNLTDEQIKAAAGTGGVVGVGPHSVFCERQRGVRPSIEAFLDHIEYIAELVGIAHVGIGTDMFGGLTLSEKVFRQQFGRVAPGFFAGYDIDTKYVEGFDDVSKFPRLTHGLLARGFSEEDIEKVLGGNFLRVFEATW